MRAVLLLALFGCVLLATVSAQPLDLDDLTDPEEAEFQKRIAAKQQNNVEQDEESDDDNLEDDDEESEGDESQNDESLEDDSQEEQDEDDSEPANQN
ncbi:hypothetical protein KR074_011256 [Drosophila pseudoananassae]|nr:hypothetical protein KR074_011256 [Drosophila pseudoananassae]